MSKPKKQKNQFEFSVTSLHDSLELLEILNGVVRVDDVIDGYMYSDIDRKVQCMVDRDVKKITFKICSYGGSVYDSMALYDLIHGLGKHGIKTEGIVEGIAASAASQIVLQACQVRSSLINSRFLIHEPRRWVMFQRERTSDMIDETKEMVAIGGVIYDIMSKRCKKTVKELMQDIERKEKWMSARDALKYGLIDRIV